MKYKATYNDRPVTITVDYDHNAECPLDYMIGEHEPILFCEHRHYNLGQKDGRDIIIDKIREHKDYDGAWEDWHAYDHGEQDFYYDLDDNTDLLAVLDKLGVYYQYVCMYEHSGMRVWLSENSKSGKEVCQFDGGTVGICVWFENDFLTSRAIEGTDIEPLEMQELMDNWFKPYADYASGEVYWIGIEDDETEEMLESISGVYNCYHTFEQMINEHFNIGEMEEVN